MPDPLDILNNSFFLSGRVEGMNQAETILREMQSAHFVRFKRLDPELAQAIEKVRQQGAELRLEYEAGLKNAQRADKILRG